MRWRPPKYGNRKTVVDGKRFASKREALRFQELQLLEKAGRIVMLRTQPRWDIVINGHKVCTYVADFEYIENWPDAETARARGYIRRKVVEDCKGARTPVYKLKKALMLAVLGIEVKET